MSTTRAKWCCPGMEHTFAQRADRGMYVFASRLEALETVTFWLAMRSVTQDALRNREFSGSTSSVPITLATRVPIKFCPWCGTRLARFYRPDGQALVDESLETEYQTQTWTVWRQDDSGNKYVVSSGHDRAEAERIARELESKGHKQIYWASAGRPDAA